FSSSLIAFSESPNSDVSGSGLKKDGADHAFLIKSHVQQCFPQVIRNIQFDDRQESCSVRTSLMLTSGSSAVSEKIPQRTLVDLNNFAELTKRQAQFLPNILAKSHGGLGIHVTAGTDHVLRQSRYRAVTDI